MSLALLRPLKTKSNTTKKKKHKFYKGKYSIDSVIEHLPKSPKYAYQLKFIVQWNKGKSTTVEFWKQNRSLHNNSVILQYMLSNEQLKQFVPAINFKENSVNFKRKYKIPLEDSDDDN